jgi:glucokinase
VAARRRPRPAGHGPEGPATVIGRLIEVGRAATDGDPRSRLGLGLPGGFINLPGDWVGREVGARIATALGRPVAPINDARAFGLAELRLGAGRGVGSMVGLTLGTGVGGVAAIDGRVLWATTARPASWHQTIDPDGHRVLRAGVPGDVRARRPDRGGLRDATAEAAVRAARAGDARAIAGLDHVGRYLGIGIANVVTLLTPDRVVIGGGVAAAGELLLAPIRAELRERVRMTPLDRVEVVVAELGTWAGAIGAAIHGAQAATARSEAGAGATVAAR